MLIEDMLTDLGHTVGTVVSRMRDAIDVAKTGYSIGRSLTSIWTASRVIRLRIF
jgi:hypothetical protein